VAKIVRKEMMYTGKNQNRRKKMKLPVFAE
jgi:hypothetical protein